MYRLLYVISGFIFFVSLFLSPSTSVYANTLSELKTALENYGIAYQKNVYIENEFSLDLSSLDDILQENYSQYTFEYEWITSGASPQTGPKFERKFETSGQKNINLSIYATESPSENLIDEFSDDNNIISRDIILQSDIGFFIYEKSIPLVIDESIKRNEVEKFFASGRDLGIYIKELGSYNEFNINGKEITSALEEYIISTPESSDYLIIWGNKEFLFTTLSQIHASNISNPLNIVLISKFNSSILKKYINNNMAHKNVLGTAFIIDEALRLQILKNPENILELQSEVEENSFEYTSLSEEITIPPFLFLSRFINSLSLSGVPVSDIYIILLLPIFLTLVSLGKHVIGISTIGIIIPVFLSFLLIKFSITFTLGILGIFFICNIVLGQIINKYALLYTPKVVCLTILNIILFMLIYMLTDSYTMLDFPLNNILYIILFFIVAEKLISLISSKEFREYKKSIWGTLIIAFACFTLYQFDALRVFLMAYPETLLIFIPLNFFIGRFTGLRVTEYFRFQEVMKNIEE